jgi:hypothetical protein
VNVLLISISRFVPEASETDPRVPVVQELRELKAGKFVTVGVTGVARSDVNRPTTANAANEINLDDFIF